MSIPDLTAEGSGYYRTYVDGVEQSQHTTERKAIQKVYQLRAAHPEADVTYDHDYLVRVGGQTTVEEPVEEEPTTEPSSGEPVVAFDPDLYSSTQELLDDPVGVFGGAELGGNINLDTEVGYPGGSHSMRYDYVDQGVDNALHVGRRIPIPRAKDVWVEFDARWSTNFLAIENPPTTDGWTFAHKLLFGEAKTSTDPNWETSEGCGVYRWALYWPTGGSSSPPHAGLGGEAPQNDDCSGQMGWHTHGDVDASQYFDAQWHTVRVHWRHDPGIYELWVDGVLLVQEEGFTVHPEIDLTAILLGRNKDDGIESGTESLWWGRMEIYTADPGW